MAGYIGSKASVVSSGAERKKVFAITTTTTSLTGLVYTPNLVHVFHNGIRLVDGTDYTATNGTTITLTNAAQNGDEVVVVSYATFQTSDTVSASAGGTFSNDLAINGDLTVDSNTLYVDAANNRVGVGTASPSNPFQVGTSDLIVDSSGTLLVGKTSSGLGTDGIEAKANGSLYVTRSSATPVSFRRSTTDGSIVNFYKDGTTVGSIGSLFTTASRFYIAGEGLTTGILFGSNQVDPMRNGALIDNSVDLGESSYRYDDVYATNGTIQTSDRNEKQDIAELDEAEKRVAVAAKGLIRKYRWKDAVAEKGDEARIHVGIIAQDLQDAFAAEGLDAGRYAMFISSTWWEHDGQTYETAEEAPEGATERTRMGVRYPELLAFIIGAM